MPASSAFRNENIMMLRPSQAERSADGGTDIQRPTLSCAADQVEKILVANKFFFRNGGSEAVMFDEMDWMKGRGIDVMEFSMRDSRNRPSKYESYFVSEKSYTAGSRSSKIKAAISFVRSQEAVSNISALIRDENPNLLHCHNIYHQLTPSIINAAARLYTPVVLTLHDYKPVCPVYTQLSNGAVCTDCTSGRFESILRKRCADGSLGRSALLWAEARYHAVAQSYQRVSQFIAPSRFMRDAVARRFGDAKVTHIPNGIDASAIQVSREDGGYVLYLGRLSSEKGVATLLKAHAADSATWRLVVAGTGPLLSELRMQFPDAEFKGHLAGADLTSVIRGAAVVVVPSEWHENSPLSILEAMAHGKTVLASRIGGIPELVRDGLSGLLFASKDVHDLSSKIRLLLADRDLRGRLGAEARKVVEAEYSLQAHGAALLALYQSVVNPLKEQNRVGV
jgi:glycosyltransferase involved in cell wall biosynthesis